MFYIKNSCNNPYYNLAFEEYVFYNIAPDEEILVLWQNEPSVIVGKYQNTIEEINSDYIEKNSINVVRRNTGGGAVYHDLGNINYSLIVPVDNLLFDFKTFTDPLVKTLQSLGINAEQLGRNDVTIDGQKFSGNAQFHANGRLLHHGTILFNSNLSNVSEALRVKPLKIESKSIKSVRSRITNILPHLKNPISIEEFKNAFLAEMRKAGTLTEYTLSDEDLAVIDSLAKEKYLSWDWNYGKSPACTLIKTSRFDCGCVDFHLDIKAHKINELYIYGDFFCSHNLKDFTDMFKGVPYTRASVKEVLSKTDASLYFQNLSDEEIINALF